jgi:D-arabinose 1-dehydrogenase-like Zn-dependent alcohol dehydrogenase
MASVPPATSVFRSLVREAPKVYVCTRDRQSHQALASELGAAWVGDADEEPSVSLDASIIFAPAGELIPPALKAIKKGGTLVLGGHSHESHSIFRLFADLWQTNDPKRRE